MSCPPPVPSHSSHIRLREATLNSELAHFHFSTTSRTCCWPDPRESWAHPNSSPAHRGSGLRHRALWVQGAEWPKQPEEGWGPGSLTAEVRSLRYPPAVWPRASPPPPSLSFLICKMGMIMSVCQSITEHPSAHRVLYYSMLCIG